MKFIDMFLNLYDQERSFEMITTFLFYVLEEEMSNWYNLPLTTHNLSKRLNSNNISNDLSETDTDDEMFSPRVRRRRRQRR